ncbi:hypothetical protein [Marinobacter fonticola]|uniref:hypothetical protein n=1 Tax=Marinobacter fonticola TaxID=2603215 RepID=UPI0011E7C9DE|nr:hypothetical protein [Marinobacter fonticola]
MPEMIMGKKTQQYSTEFKVKAVEWSRQAHRSVKGVAEAFRFVWKHRGQHRVKALPPEYLAVRLLRLGQPQAQPESGSERHLALRIRRTYDVSGEQYAMRMSTRHIVCRSMLF